MNPGDQVTLFYPHTSNEGVVIEASTKKVVIMIDGDKYEFERACAAWWEVNDSQTPVSIELTS